MLRQRLTCLSALDQEAVWGNGLHLMLLCTPQRLHHLALTTSQTLLTLHAVLGSRVVCETRRLWLITIVSDTV